MVLAGSLQLSYGLGLCKNQGRSKQFKSGIGRDKLHFGSALSSRVSFCRQDSGTIHLVDHAYRNRTIHLPYRYNAFKCHFSPVSGQPLELPRLKTAAMALTRSFNVLQGSPLLPKLVLAVGIAVFAVWGLAPIMRLSRNLILKKSDSSWKKSNTYYITTSYLQPLLLWSGATLVCRALDPIVLPTEASQIVKLRLLNFVRSLSTVLAFAYCLSSFIQQAQKFFMETNDTSDTRNMGFQFAGKAVYSAVWIAAFSLFMELLGFSTQRWLTAGGLGTVLLTLAGREIFTNFLSSAMIHATRPFVANEWIQTKIEGYEVSGTVEHVGWWSPTIIRGEDREAVHIPNHKFTVNVVRNLSQKTHWRIKTHLAISHLDVHKIHNIVADMRKVLAKNPQVEQQRLHRRVFLDNINPENQALLIMISCFVKTSHHEEYLCVKEAILLDLLRVISHHRARLATPIRTVQKIYSDADLENVPFAEAFYGRGGVAPHSPFLLIEPPYKINGEDKTKKGTVRTNGDRDGKTTGKAGGLPASDSKTKETSTSDTKKNAKIGETKNFDTKEDHQAVAASFSDPKKQDKMAKPISKSSSSEIGAEKAGESTNTQGKPESERKSIPQPPTSRPVLEENIVLGVALEGSKRTLPIEEGMVSPPPHTEVTEMAARRNGHGSPAADKDKKDGHTSASPGSTSVDK